MTGKKKKPSRPKPPPPKASTQLERTSKALVELARQVCRAEEELARLRSQVQAHSDTIEMLRHRMGMAKRHADKAYLVDAPQECQREIERAIHEIDIGLDPPKFAPVMGSIVKGEEEEPE